MAAFGRPAPTSERGEASQAVIILILHRLTPLITHQTHLLSHSFINISCLILILR